MIFFLGCETMDTFHVRARRQLTFLQELYLKYIYYCTWLRIVFFAVHCDWLVTAYLILNERSEL